MFQPKFPLELSDLEGAYSSIKDIKENIKQNVTLLLMTSPGEWPGHPEIGIGVRRFLFSNYPSPELLNISKAAKDQFSRYLPFINVDTELVDRDERGNSFVDRNELKFVVKYNVPSLNIYDTVTLGVSELAQEPGL